MNTPISRDSKITFQLNGAAKTLIALGLFSGIASIQFPDIPLLMLLSAISLGLVLSAWLKAPRKALCRIVVQAKLPTTGFEGCPLRFPITLSSDPKAPDIFDVIVSLRFDGEWRPVGFAESMETTFLEEDSVAPGWGGVLIEGLATHHRRGRYRRFEVALSTSYGFGLVHCRRVIPVESSLDVYPLVERRPIPLPFRSHNGPQHRARSRSFEPAEDLRGLHVWRQGENPRLIHWKSSAKRRQWMTREFDGNPSESVELILIPFVQGVAHKRTHGRHRGFEQAVREAASLLRAFHRGGWKVSLRIPDHDSDLPLSRAKLQVQDLSETFARLAALNPQPLPMDRARERIQSLLRECETSPKDSIHPLWIGAPEISHFLPDSKHRGRSSVPSSGVRVP